MLGGAGVGQDESAADEGGDEAQRARAALFAPAVSSAALRTPHRVPAPVVAPAFAAAAQRQPPARSGRACGGDRMPR
jgi:hypothetical protein